MCVFDDLPKLSQEWLHTTYLTPENNIVLAPGHINNWTNGAMHAGRISIYVDILHKLFKKYVHNTKNEIYALEKYLNLDEAQIIQLTCYLRLILDTPESTDRFIERKVLLTYRYLQDKTKFDENTINFFKLLLSQLGKCGENNFFQVPNLPTDVIKCLTYLKTLLELSKCFDSIRYTCEFNYQDIQNILSSIPEYEAQNHDPIFFAFSQEVCELLREMHDLYSSVTIIGPLKQQKEIKAHFSLKEKAKVEHAPRVIDQIYAYMWRQSYFRDYIPEKTLQAVSFDYDNPLIHGTSSTMLPLLVKTEGQILGPIDMLQQYGLAPLCGELTEGGLYVLAKDCPPCFAPVVNEGTNYDLAAVKSYANVTTDISRLKDETKASLDHLIKENNLFGDFKLALIYLARYRELGGDISQYYEYINEQLYAVRQLFYFYLLLAENTDVDTSFCNKLYALLMIVIDFIISIFNIIKEKIGAINNDKENGHIKPVLNKPLELTYKGFLEFISAKQIDFVKLYQDYNQRDFQKALDFFKAISVGFIARTKPRDVKDAPYPVDRPDLFCKGECNYTPDRLFSNFGRDRNISYYNNGLDLLGEKFTSGTKELIEFHIKNLTKALEILNNKLAIPLPDNQLIDLSEQVIKKSTPMIFIHNDFDGFYGMSNGEFRAYKPLKLGADIHQIATDTEENKDILHNYLTDNGFKNVNIILFSELDAIMEKIKRTEQVLRAPKISFFSKNESVTGKPEIFTPSAVAANL